VDSAPKTPLLDRVKTPEDLRKLEESELPQLADELRRETIDAVSVTGGHLGAGLGVVELTVALHWVFDTPRDRLVWDVGHQTYPHKIITGRRDRIRTLRAPGGLSGFTRRAESEYDPFGAAHSSTSISAGLGMAVARDLAKRDNNVVCVIGDGAMSAGMAYEALNNAGARDERLIVVLNDNDMSIAPPTGALSSYLARITSSGTYLYLRDIAKQLARQLPKSWERRAARMEEYTRHLWQGGAWFEELGFYYVGPIDGHNFDHLLPVLKNVRDARQGPILVHVVTKKGKGYGPAEASDDKYHGVSKFNVVTGAQDIAKPKAPSYTRVFADALVAEAKKDDKIVAITAAMPDGTGLDRFGKAFPERMFDVASPSSTPSRLRPVWRPRASSPSPPSIRPSCSAPTTRSCTTLPSRGCLFGSPSTAPVLSVPMVPRTPAPSMSPTCPACRGSSSWPPPTRPNSCTWWRPRRRSMTALRPCVIRAARASAYRFRRKAFRWRSARAACCAKDRPWRCCRSAPAPTNVSRRPTSSLRSGCRRPLPTHASPSRSMRI